MKLRFGDKVMVDCFTNPELKGKVGIYSRCGAYHSVWYPVMEDNIGTYLFSDSWNPKFTLMPIDTELSRIFGYPFPKIDKEVA